ncbi:hypothetical protein BKA65DRAFT_532551 [Rhexocercosporidium sp. MPI-PUGE-AT-0058]|nr:hypothetical protein BKA65DRAFT_532551 [Rhexocercosporidium sp. MPI-PUGE-AT-0058]
MSFGFGVGDFLAVGKLSIHLWRSFKDAPKEFAEVSRELSSINIVIVDLSDQAGSATSLLNRRGASRKDELMALCDNLMGVLEELQDIYRKYRNMGRNAWMRVRLGERDLTALRSKLSLHLGLIETFVASLTLASVGRMEPMMVEVLRILRSMARGHGAGASSLLDAQACDEVDDGRAALERELQTEGIPMEFVQDHMDDIMTLVDEVIDEEMLAFADDIRPRDSASQVAGQSSVSPATSGHSSPTSGNSQMDGLFQPNLPTLFPHGTIDHMLEVASKEDIHATTIRMQNLGYNLKRIGQPVQPPVKSLRQKIWESSRDKAEWTQYNRRKTERREYGEKALCDAAHRCDVLAVLLILRGGVDVNTRTQRDLGTLIYCAIAGPKNDSETTSMIELLVRFKGDVRIATSRQVDGDDHGTLKRTRSTNLIQATLSGKENAVKFLMDNGVLLHRTVLDSMGSPVTALHAAASKQHVPIVKLLLERGADVNRGKYYTPLDSCYDANGKGSETEKLLIAAGGVARYKKNSSSEDDVTND